MKCTQVTDGIPGFKRCRTLVWKNYHICKLPLAVDNLNTIFNALNTNSSYDDILFTTQLFTGFKNLLCLGELCWPDKVALCDYHKVTMQHAVEKFNNYISHSLPAHKGDAFFEGN